MNEDQLRRLQRRAHVHKGSARGDLDLQPDGSCYGMYEPCGEHHQHSLLCGGRALLCDRGEDPDLLALCEERDKLIDVIRALPKCTALRVTSSSKNAPICMKTALRGSLGDDFHEWYCDEHVPSPEWEDLPYAAALRALEKK